MSQSVGSRGVYDYITSYNSYGYNGYASIDCYVVHWWDSPAKAPTFDGTCNSLCNNPNGSAHYVVESGRVACLIAPGLRAWHVSSNDYQKVMSGIYDINSHSVGIECNPRCTDGDIETLCQLLADLWLDYGVKPIYGHLDFMATECPGTYYASLDYIRKRTKEIYNNIINDVPDNNVADINEPSEWAKDAWDKAHELGLLDGTRPHDNVTREELAAVLVRLSEK